MVVRPGRKKIDRQLVFEYMFEYTGGMEAYRRRVRDSHGSGEYGARRDVHPAQGAPPTRRVVAPNGQERSREREGGLLHAMSPGVVDFLFRQLIGGGTEEDSVWLEEGSSLDSQQPGPELARRLAETDVEALTPTELFIYVRAAQRLADWSASLRAAAQLRYCAQPAEPGASSQDLR